MNTSGAQGFAGADFSNVVVTVGGKTPLDIELKVGGQTTMVDIAMEGQIVETTRSSISSTINQRAIDNLPVNGRNFLDFATLTPGVVREPTRAGDLSVGGQKGTLNSLQVDGADNNNTFQQSFGRTGASALSIFGRIGAGVSGQSKWFLGRIRARRRRNN